MQYNIVVTKQSTDRPFFDLYNYSACLNLNGASALRHWRDHDIDLARSDVIKRWRWRGMRSHLIIGGLMGASRPVRNQGGSWRVPVRETDEESPGEQCVLAMLDRLRMYQQHIKVQVSHDQLYVYSNDLAIIDDLRQLDGVQLSWVKQAQVDRPRDVVLLRTVNHSRRSYLRERWLPPEQVVHLRNFLEHQTEIRISPGMTKWLMRDKSDARGMYVPSGWFIDHNDSGEIFLLEMCVPRLVRKTVDIQQR